MGITPINMTTFVKRELNTVSITVCKVIGDFLRTYQVLIPTLIASKGIFGKKRD